MSSLADLIAQKRVNSEDESDSFDEFEPEDLKEPIVPKRPVKQESSESEPTDPTPIPQRPTKKNGGELKHVPPGDAGTTVDPGPPNKDPEISVPVIPARPKRPIKEDKADQAETEDGKSAETSSATSEEETKAEKVLESHLGPDDVESETIEAGDEGETKVDTKADTKADSRSPEPVIPPRPSKQPVIPQRPQRAKTQEKELPVSRNEEGEVIDALPVIPQRPQRVKTQEKKSQATREPEAEVEETKEEESTVQSPPKIQKEDSEPTSPNKLKVTDIKESPLEPEPTHVDELAKADSNDSDELVDKASKQLEDCKPIAVIPPRPRKPLSRASTQDSIMETDNTKGKAPPPVPKKPSSKIAAFQEMLRKNQEAEEEKSKVFERSGSPPKPDRNAFKTNLNTLFALPGMARPDAIPAALKPQVAEEEEEEKEKDEEPVQSDARRSRAKGPRGKRLPKSAVEKVEFDDKRSIAVFDIWSSGHFNGEGIDFNKFKPRVIETPVADDEYIEKALHSEIEREDAEQSVESKDASVLVEENAEEQQEEQKEEEQEEPDVQQKDTSFEGEHTKEKPANSTILQTIDGGPELSKPEEEAESVEVEQEDDADIDTELSPEITPKEDDSIARLERELDVAKEE